MSHVKDARREGTLKYERHKPEQTLLYRIVEKYYPQFLTHMRQQDKGLPKYVRSEFEAYLKCGSLEYGFLRVRCEDFHCEHLVAFSCKRRGFYSGLPALRASLRLFKIVPNDFVSERQCAANGKKRDEWQKAPPCWLMMCCPMSQLGNGY